MHLNTNLKNFMVSFISLLYVHFLLPVPSPLNILQPTSWGSLRDARVSLSVAMQQRKLSHAQTQTRRISIPSRVSLDRSVLVKSDGGLWTTVVTMCEWYLTTSLTLFSCESSLLLLAIHGLNKIVALVSHVLDCSYLLEEDNTVNTMVTRPSTLSILRLSLLVLHDYILEEQHHKYNGDASFHPFYSHTLIPFILHKLCGCGMTQAPRTSSYIKHPLAAITSVNCT